MVGDKMNKKGQSSVHITVGVILILAGISFLINYPVLGYVLGGVGVIIESVIKLVQGGIGQ